RAIVHLHSNSRGICHTSPEIVSACLVHHDRSIKNRGVSMTSLDASGTVPTGTTEQWRDKKRYLWLLGLVVPSLAFVAFLGKTALDISAFLWLGPIIILLIIPVIDLSLGLDSANPPDDVIEALENDRYYRWITFTYLPIQYAGFATAMWLIATADWSLADRI